MKRHVKLYESWKESRGVVEFKVKGTTYTLYKGVAQKGSYELYKFDEDHGPLILRFRIEGGKLVYLYGGFDMDAASRANIDEIIESLFDYFKIESDGKGIESRKIEFKN